MRGLMAQVRAVVAMNLKSLPSRASTALVTVLAVAIVVAVLLSFLSMASGFRQTVAGSGAHDVAILMREGSEAELNSTITRDQVNILLTAPGLAQGAGGGIGSPELYVIVDGVRRENGLRANLPLRGIAAEGMGLRPGMRLVEGRMFTPGTNEMVVGAGALREFSGFELGREISFNRTKWRVVGVFSTGGSVFESELWADARSVQSLFQRGSTYQTMRLKLAVADDISALQAFVAADPRLNLDVKTEASYFAEQSARTSDMIMYLGWPLGIAMAFGALAGALNTMYTSVALRSRDIATLRAIGFSGSAAFAGTLAESLVLSLSGGLLGSLAAYLFFDGLSTSTLGSSFTQVVFRFDLSLALFWQGALLALAIGFVGGVFPAWRAARMPVAAAFRG